MGLFRAPIKYSELGLIEGQRWQFYRVHVIHPTGGLCVIDIDESWFATVGKNMDLGISEVELLDIVPEDFLEKEDANYWYVTVLRGGATFFDKMPTLSERLMSLHPSETEYREALKDYLD